MTVLTEGDLKITIPDGFPVRKFDGNDHGLSHCMKAVDFIVEEKNRYLFIEFKNPQRPDSVNNAEEFKNRDITEALKYKYRDTFLYEWASGKVDKPIYYFVLLAIDTLDKAALATRTNELKHILPCGTPSTWKKEIAADCAVFNIETWNENLPAYPITRISA